MTGLPRKAQHFRDRRDLHPFLKEWYKSAGPWACRVQGSIPQGHKAYFAVAQLVQEIDEARSGATKPVEAPDDDPSDQSGSHIDHQFLPSRPVHLGAGEGIGVPSSRIMASGMGFHLGNLASDILALGRNANVVGRQPGLFGCCHGFATPGGKETAGNIVIGLSNFV
jgi:hypothetical protein